jgi:hypothetical protein
VEAGRGPTGSRPFSRSVKSPNLAHLGDALPDARGVSYPRNFAETGPLLRALRRRDEEKSSET